MIETKRLRLYPATRDQMQEFIDAQTNGALRAAYTEMLENCLKHPEQWDWYAIWMIERKDGIHIGELCFKGLDLGGVAEIGYGISEDCRNRGYATEAVKAALRWAFQDPNVTAIEAETDAENLPSKRVLAKCGFLPNGKTGEEGSRFTVTR